MNINGDTVKRWRKDKKLTQVEFGKLLGWDKFAASAVERGERKISEAERVLLELYIYGKMPANAPVFSGKLTFGPEIAPTIIKMSQREGFESPEEWVITKIKAYLAMHEALPTVEETGLRAKARAGKNAAKKGRVRSEADPTHQGKSGAGRKASGE